LSWAPSDVGFDVELRAYVTAGPDRRRRRAGRARGCVPGLSPAAPFCFFRVARVSGPRAALWRWSLSRLPPATVISRPSDRAAESAAAQEGSMPRLNWVSGEGFARSSPGVGGRARPRSRRPGRGSLKAYRSLFQPGRAPGAQRRRADQDHNAAARRSHLLAWPFSPHRPSHASGAVIPDKFTRSLASGDHRADHPRPASWTEISRPPAHSVALCRTAWAL